jgi:hypothetical protein
MATVMENQGWRQATGLELVPFPAGALVVDSVALTTRGGSPSFDHWAEAAERLRKVHGATKYWIGDLLNMGEGLFSEQASQVIDQSYLSEAEVKQYTYVAKQVAPTTRAHAQSWDHARVVAGLKPEAQAEWLDKSRAEDWSARKLASELAGALAEPGKTTMRWWLVVETKTEALRDKLAEELEGRGHGVKRQEKLTKVAKPKRGKKAEVTAQRKHKGAPKRNTVQRPPQ